MTTANLAERVLEWAKEQCRENNVKFYFSKGKYLKLDGVSCGGYFSNEKGNMTLACSHCKDWHLTMAHEVGHLQQEILKTKAWHNYENCPTNINSWLNYEKEYTPQEINRMIKVTIEMEREAEEFSLAALTSFGYTNSKEYIQKANSYLLFYYFVGERRCWSKRYKAPYRIAKIWKAMPDTFDINHKEVYKQVKHLYELCV